MKLAKKMLACAMALAMVAALALTAFAAAPVVTLTADQYANVGDTVTVTVSATGMAGLESADLEIHFDATALKYVKATQCTGDMGTGKEVSEGVVTWSFFYMEACEADSDIVKVEFEVLKEGDANVEVVVLEWVGTEVPAGASVVVSQKAAPTTAAPTTEAPTTAAPTTAAPTTAAPTTAEPTEAASEAPTTGDRIPQTGEAGVAAIAGVMALAAVAFVATRKKDEE